MLSIRLLNGDPTIFSYVQILRDERIGGSMVCTLNASRPTLLDQITASADLWVQLRLGNSFILCTLLDDDSSVQTV